MPGATLTITDEAGETQTVELTDVALSDSRAQMPELTNIAKALSLDEDADEAKILEAIGAKPALDPAKVAEALGIEAHDEDAILKAISDRPEGEEIDLEKVASDKGLKLVKADDFDELVSNAAAGKKAADELKQSKFDTAFDKALSDGKVDAKSETRERFQKLYEADADTALAVIEGLPKIVSTEARGSGEGKGDAPEGVDADRFDIDKAAQALMADDKELTYEDAVRKVMTDRSES